MMPQLSILVCTINDRVRLVPELLLPERADVVYVVAFQYTDSIFLDMIPEELRLRPDVEILPHPSTGLSRNRNVALGACRTEYALIADDDVRYTNEQLDMVIRTFQSHPDVDIACFQARNYDGKFLKTYPSTDFDYAHTPKNYFYSSVEIALRGDVEFPRFDTRLGLGSTYLACGEEEVFLYQSHCIGLHIHYFPELLCTYHHGLASSALFLENKRVRRSRGAVHHIIHGAVGGFLHIVKEALLQPSMRWISFRDMMDGYRYIFRTE